MTISKRLQLEISFLGILFLITTLLYFKGTMYKTEYWGLDTNPVFQYLFYTIIIAYLLFNHFILRYRIITNLLTSLFIYASCIFLSNWIFWSAMGVMEKNDRQRTPLGWQFNFKWYLLLLMAVLVVVLSEMIYAFIKNRKYLVR